VTNWREVHTRLDPSQNLYNEWQRLAPDTNYNTFRKMVGALGGKRGKIIALRGGVFTETEDGAVVASQSSRITSLDDLLQACNVDLRLWQVDRFEISKHEVQRKDTIKDLYFDEGKVTGTLSDSGGLNIEPIINIKAWLKRRVEAPLDQAVDAIIARLARSAPRYAPPKPLHPTGKYLLVPAIFDAHFNKRSADETYSIAQAAHDFMAAAEALAARTQAMGFGVRRVMIPVGNDALHADNLHGSTTKGTLVEMAGSQGRAIDALCEAVGFLVERMAVIAPVDVIMVPGNHDRYSTHWLGRVLAAQFGKHPRVTVDATCPPRSYYQFGKTLLGLTHGDKTADHKLGEMMAHEARQMWADTTHQEWLLGHWHGKRGLRRYINEEYGVTLRVFPALCPTDEYHALHGFIGNRRAATGMLYHEDHGLAVEYPVFVDELAQSAERPSFEVVKGEKAA
jgi:hypothetical protein